MRRAAKTICEVEMEFGEENTLAGLLTDLLVEEWELSFWRLETPSGPAALEREADE